MELYAARHGETLSNIQRLFTGSSDSPLTEKGVEQAKLLGKSLENIIFDAVYSSPLKRAVETVKIAFGDRYEILIDDRLAEINLGVMEGMVFEDVVTKYPESGLLFFTDPVLYKTAPNGESLEDIIKRISSFLDDIAKCGHNKIFALTHGYALRVMYACTKGGTRTEIAEAPGFSNCDLICFTYEGGKWALKES